MKHFDIGATYEFNIHHIQSPSGEIWGHLQTSVQDVRELSHVLDFFYSKCGDKIPPLTQAKVGQLCCARTKRFDDDGWARGKIIQLDESKDNLRLFFQDYGHTQWIPLTKVKMLKNTFNNLPSFTVQIKPSDITKSDYAHDEELSAQFCQQLEKLILHQKIKCIVEKIEETDLHKILVARIYLANGRNESIGSILSQQLRRMRSTFQHILPDCKEGQDIDISILHVHNPGQFYCRIASQQSQDNIKMDELERCLRLYYGLSISTDQDYPLQVGAACAAPFTDRKWHRGIIKQIVCDDGDKEALVQSVDTGACELIDNGKIKGLEPELQDIPVNIFQCQLHGIKPNDSKSTWSVDSTLFLQQLAQEQRICGLVRRILHDNSSIGKQLYSVELHRPGENLTVNEQMIMDGFAASSLSRQSTRSITSPDESKNCNDIDNSQLDESNNCKSVCQSNASKVSFGDEMFDVDHNEERNAKTLVNSPKSNSKVNIVGSFKHNEQDRNDCKKPITYTNGENLQAKKYQNKKWEAVAKEEDLIKLVYDRSRLVTSVDNPDVIVAFIKDPGEFWCQFASNISIINDIQARMNEYSQQKRLRIPKDIKSGECYCTRFDKDDVWYRGKVIGKFGDKASVYFIDYGNTDWVQLKDIMVLENDFRQHPWQAFTCKLDGVCPILGSSWGSKATDQFTEMVTSKTFCMTIKTEIDDKLSIILVDNESKQINNRLVEIGVANKETYNLLKKQLSSTYSKNWRRTDNDYKTSMPTMKFQPSISASHEKLTTTDVTEHTKHKQPSEFNHVQKVEERLSLIVGKKTSVCVMHVESPNCFYAVIPKIDSFIDMEKKLQDFCANARSPVSPDEFCLGKMYVAFSTKFNKWCRCILTDKNERGVITCDVFYIDYGTAEKSIQGTSLKILPPKFHETKDQALKCYLTPASAGEDLRSNWHPMASLQLENLCHDKWLDGTITRVDQDGKLFGLSITIANKDSPTKDRNVYDMLSKFIRSDSSKSLNISATSKSGLNSETNNSYTSSKLGQTSAMSSKKGSSRCESEVDTLIFAEGSASNSRELSIPLQPEIIRISGRKGERVLIPSKVDSTSTPITSNGHRSHIGMNNIKNGLSTQDRFSRLASAV
ncbi:Tudor domain-containing protein 1 [Trichoplax sp. H2]|nr:Tudor domain-containing protein 1 [Trichoplax sp. H2]|eukprot:RDD46172.1 Tudor domain-containing protein 1 [Trichoplax sp. H2]